MPWLHMLAIAAAAFGAGVVNAVAGGGTLITFPVLTALGLPAVVANVTNTVALCPGYVGGTWAQRADLAGQGARLRLLLPAGAIGGVVGGWLLLQSGERVFRSLVPFLILGASLLLAAQDPLRRFLQARTARHVAARRALVTAALPVGVAAIYGGYFGAGLGVIMLAVLSLTLDDTLTRLNAVKQALSLVINVTASVFFVAKAEVSWTTAGLMALAALAGGVVGGRLAGRVRPQVLRGAVVATGLVVSVVYLVR
ncbi:MAG: sulfite exporter TauE/SafE family protein [Acidobacteria bacterium]|nr:sulfite exporter TauE/SafE family protein [Acidobacteriota bacterium]